MAPFSPRARPGAPVSFPITWDEVAHCAPGDFTVANVKGLLDSRGVEQWMDGLKTKHRLPRG